MESSNADNSTFNGTSTTNVPRDESTIESMLDGILSQIQEMLPAYPLELELNTENKLTEVILRLLECVKEYNAELEEKVFHLRIKLHKYESAKSTCLENKEHCCICLDDYCDGEELAKIYCGHVYHVDCIKEWIKLKCSCPICKMDAVIIQPEKPCIPC